jgi:hypothetical protein
MSANFFEQIAPYLKDPLILIGFFLFIGFLFLRTLVTKGVIPTLQKNQGYNILKLILLYGFIIGLLLIGLGFGLKYKELSKSEQKNIVNLLLKELDGNISVVSELKKNTETFLNGQLTLSKALRTKEIKILPIMFPLENLDLDKDVNTNSLSQQAFLTLIKLKLPNNKLEMMRLNAFSNAITKTIVSIRSTNQDLRDSSRIKYRITDEVWKANIETYKKLNIIDITIFQKVYTQLNHIRNDYEIVSKSTIDYQNALAVYFEKDNDLTWDKLAVILSQERYSFDLMIEYSKNIANTIADISNVKQKLDSNLVKVNLL